MLFAISPRLWEFQECRHVICIYTYLYLFILFRRFMDVLKMAAICRAPPSMDTRSCVIYAVVAVQADGVAQNHPPNTGVALGLFSVILYA